MAGLFTTRRANATSSQAYTLRVQTSIQGVPRPIVYGQARTAGNMIDYGGFIAIPVKQSGGGKGGGGGGGRGKSGPISWKYYAGGMISLGEPIANVLTIYNGSAIDFLVVPPPSVLANLFLLDITPTYGNATYFAGVYSGGQTSPDGGWAARFPSHALAYRGEAYVVFGELALGSSATFPNFNFEVLGLINSDIPALGPDANPADVIADILTNVNYGVPGFPANALGDFNTARNYWRATGLLISDVLTSGVSAQSYLKSLMEALNCEFRWSSGVLDIVPYADQPVTGSGYSFTPNLTPVYALTVDDFLPNQGSLGSASTAGKVAVAFQRISLNQVNNKVQIEYLSRYRLYNPVSIYATDDASIISTGRLKMSGLRQNHFFALDSAASVSVALQLTRETAEMNTYQCTVGRQFVLLDPMDIVTLTEPALQLQNQLCRITEIQENSDQSLTLTLVEVPGTAGAPIYQRQASLGTGRNANAPAPVINPPIFFEPPDQLGGGLVLWIGLSGQTPANFGGCDVWLSSDGETYANIGTFEGQSRMGVTTSAITAVPVSTANPVTIDTTNTLGVALAESAAALANGSATDLTAFNTAFVVDSEIIAYQTATLTGTSAYNLAPLARGGYDTTIAAHASGANFLRLDGNVFEWLFDASRIGAPLYFKFTSFNAFGGGEQNLSDVGAYVYTPTGAALTSPLPNVTNLYSNFEAGFQKIYWDEVTDFRNGVVYEIRKGSSWASSTLSRTQAHPPYIADGLGTYWIAAKCAPVAGLTVYSPAPQSLTVAGNQLSANLVFSYDEQANGWPGTCQNGIGVQGIGSTAFLRLGGSGNILTDSNVLTNPDILDYGGIIPGPVYYTSANVIDVGYVAQASLNATSEIVGTPVGQNILAITDFLNTPDILSTISTGLVSGWVEVNVGQYQTDAFAPSDVFAAPDAFKGPTTWSGWQKFVPGVQLGSLFQFRIALLSSDPSTLAVALKFNYQVQVAPRIDHYQNLSVTTTGLLIPFQPDGATVPGAFNGGPNGQALPYVNVSWASQPGDTYTITLFTIASLTITFFNSGVAVERDGVNVDVEGF